MKNQNHVIKKQIIDVTLDSEIGSFAFQSRLSDIFRTEILPLIDDHCTKISGGSEIIRFDRLELDLGLLDKRNLVKEFKSKIDELFSQKLSAVFRVHQAGKDIPARTSAISANDFYKGKPLTITQKERDFELLAHFIREGRLPWWVKNDELPEIGELLKEMVNGEPAMVKAFLTGIAKDHALVQRVLYNADRSILEKIIALFHPQQAKEVCNRLTSDLIETFMHSPFFGGFSLAMVEMEICLALLKQVLTSDEGNFNRRTIVKNVVKHLATKFGYEENALYSYLAEERGDGSRILDEISLPKQALVEKRPMDTISKPWAGRVDHPTSVYCQQLENLARQIKELNLILSEQQRLLASSFVDELAIVLRQTGKAIQSIQEVILNMLKKAGKASVYSMTALEMNEEEKKKVEEFEQLSERLYLLLAAVQEQKTPKLDGEVLAKAERIKAAIIELSKKAQAPGEGREANILANTEEIFLRNAGLVLLWPYLPAFFETTGLVKDKQFVSAEAKGRAVLLLHYLTFGNKNGQEYEMTLNKILCGLDLGVPVKPNLDQITKTEVQECESLLQAVIHNWPALKKMSVPALRSMFLRREGMLFTRDGYRVLKVTEETYDLLLDQMPWGIGTVRLPWMEQFLLVEWRM